MLRVAFIGAVALSTVHGAKKQNFLLTLSYQYDILSKSRYQHVFIFWRVLPWYSKYVK